jgi:hypothetical protein
MDFVKYMLCFIKISDCNYNVNYVPENAKFFKEYVSYDIKYIQHKRDEIYTPPTIPIESPTIETPTSNPASEQTTPVKIVTSQSTPGINHAPVISPIGSQQVKVGQTLTIRLSATDPDGDSISYGYVNDGNYVTSDNSKLNQNIWTWTPAKKGIIKVQFVVTDSRQLSAVQTVEITVI